MSWARIHPDSKRLLDDMGITSIFGAPQTQQAAPPPRPDVAQKNQIAPRAAPKAAAQTSLVHSMEFEDVAGAHAVIVQSRESGAIVIEEIPQGGQLAMQGVQAGDMLTRIDGRPISGDTSLKLVKALVEGKPGTTVELELERYDGVQRVKFVVKVIRTLTVSEDVQIGVYDELERLLDNNFDFTPAVTDSSDQGVPAKEAHDRVCRKLVSLKQGKPLPAPTPVLRNTGDSGDPQVAMLKQELEMMSNAMDQREKDWKRINQDLRNTIKERETRLRQLEDDFTQYQNNESIALTMTLREDFETKVPTHRGRGEYEKRLAQEVSQALGIERERVEVVGLHKGSVNVDMSIHPAAQSGQQPSIQAYKALEAQIADPHSTLKKTDNCRSASKLQMKSPSEWISRLKRTCDQLQLEKELLTDDCQVMGEELAVMRGHKDGRTELLMEQQREQQREIERLRTELNSQQEARKTQVATLSDFKAKEELKLSEQIKNLHQEVSAQDQRLREMQTQLHQSLSELEIAKSELARIQGESERQRNTIETLQADSLMTSVRHQEVLSLTERALDDANATIDAQREELKSIGQVKEALASSEQALKGQMMTMEQLKARHAQQLELIDVQLQKDKSELDRKHASERDEFVMHLENAEETVRTLRSELETRLIAQNELVRKLATQEELVRNLGSQHQSRDEQVRKLRADSEIMATSMDALEKELRKEQQERQMLQGENRQLKVEENTWKRVEKMRLLQDLDGLREENRVMRERLTAVDGQLLSGQSQMQAPAQTQMLMRSSELSQQQASKLAERLATLEQELDERNLEVASLANKAVEQQRSIEGLQQALADKHRVPSAADNRNSVANAPGGPSHERLQKRVLELESLLQEKEQERARAAMEAESWRNAAGMGEAPVDNYSHAQPVQPAARPFSFF